MSYVLRVEIELDPREAVDDVAAREQAKAIYAELTQAIYAELTLGQFNDPSQWVTVKLQKRHPTQMPRSVRFP